jgi:hypothetical protein
VLVRDTMSWRPIGGGQILRAAGGAESLVVPVGDATGPVLEVEVQDLASPPLTIPTAKVSIGPRSILFFTPNGATLELRYGSRTSDAPAYDLPQVFTRGRPPSLAPALLGPVVDHGATSAQVPPHGAAVDPGAWKTRVPIALPPGSGVARLDLDAAESEHPNDVRVVDAENRQVPYLFERTMRRSRTDAKVASRQDGRLTVLTISELGSPQGVESLELTAPSPEYFTRTVIVDEAIRDARGVTGRRALGSATWQRRPGEAPTALVVPIGQPTAAEVEVRIDNGDNAPFVVTAAAILRRLPRVDFVYASGESLSLLVGNPSAGAPDYDIVLLADTILGAPAQPASLGTPVTAPGKDDKDETAAPKWFWAAVMVAGLVVAGVLSRTLKAPRKSDGA